MPTLQAAATAMCKPIIFRPSLKKKEKYRQVFAYNLKTVLHFFPIVTQCKIHLFRFAILKEKTILR